MTVGRVCAGLLVALGTSASAQEFKAWKHGVIEPKGDAGFMLMVGQRDFGAKAQTEDRNRAAEERGHRTQSAAGGRT